MNTIIETEFARIWLNMLQGSLGHGKAEEQEDAQEDTQEERDAA
jgi:hypothetical protein